MGQETSYSACVSRPLSIQLRKMTGYEQGPNHYLLTTYSVYHALPYAVSLQLSPTLSR